MTRAAAVVEVADEVRLRSHRYPQSFRLLPAMATMIALFGAIAAFV